MTTPSADNLFVTGQINNVLFSLVNRDNTRQYGINELGFSIGFGATGNNRDKLMKNMGELLTIPGKAFYLPSKREGNPSISHKNDQYIFTPFNVNLGNLDGECWKEVEFHTKSLKTGEMLERWIQDIDPNHKYPLYGFVYTCKIKKLDGAWVIKSPFEETKPENGKKIGDPENVKEYFNFVSEEQEKGIEAIMVGAALDSNSPVLDTLRGKESLVFYRNPGDKDGGGRYKIHEHGVLFRRTAQKRVENIADIVNLVEEKNFLDVKHILDTCEVSEVSGILKGYSDIEDFPR